MILKHNKIQTQEIQRNYTLMSIHGRHKLPWPISLDPIPRPSNPPPKKYDAQAANQAVHYREKITLHYLVINGL